MALRRFLKASFHRPARRCGSGERRQTSQGMDALEQRVFFAVTSPAPRVLPRDPPTVSAVSLTGTRWTSDFIERLVNQSIGFNPEGYWVPSHAGQLTPVPWTNVDRIWVSFSGVLMYIDGTRTIQAEDLTVHGVDVPRYSFSTTGTAPAFNYDPVAHAATWTLSQSVPADRLTLELDADAETGGVHDSLGTYLDGDWVNGADEYPSGDGVEGGDFLFQINVLPGDATRDGAVNALDLADVKRRMNTRATDEVSTAPGAYSPFADLNADGRINALDLSAVRQRLNTRLPAAQPVATAAPAPAAPAALTLASATESLFSSDPVLGA
jgi:hypothetical protein